MTRWGSWFDFGKSGFVINGGSKIMLLVGIVGSLHSSSNGGVLDLHSPKHGGSSSEYVGRRVKVLSMRGELESELHRFATAVGRNDCCNG